ncbi:tRNA pseudouridine13 synthase [Marinobacter pelagius]|uniref:tRNA pseudouridine synthase D n=1 Tax=Marinobacter pelagius TaxID=379482 RepID=A0A366GSR5_9GAMM|nr:tRNA pseudouridine(13) synthase TruD [Marinobacter pelagius]RBP31013.1 tRNA pseudouridine13 synthase [Marinobacter pelagius]
MSNQNTTGHQWRLDWPTSHGRVARAQLKSVPEDFRVEEVLTVSDLIPGEGEHLCLCLEKTGDNTEFVARQLARMAGCRGFDVGFCGLKDRHAVTTQWFSLYRPGMEASDDYFIREVDGHWRVLASARAPRKLRRGEHSANRFAIVLRNVEGSKAEIDEALDRLGEQGAPNYFGPQRFGHDGGNLDRALKMDPSQLNRRKGRAKRGSRGGRDGSKNVLYFSAARSWLFNEVLATRVSDGSWNTCLSGEPAESAAGPTGPMWGDGGTTATDGQEAVERDVVGKWPELERLFAATRMQPERRPLVVQPQELDWEWQGGDTLFICFVLPPGQYATTVLGDIFELEDMSLGRHNE